MKYIITRYDGSILVNLDDHIIDKTTTSISLVGHKAFNYGQSMTQNFVNITENFAANSAPKQPMVGQMWFDKLHGVMKYFNGVSWITVSISSGIGNFTPHGITFDLIQAGTPNQTVVFDSSGTLASTDTLNLANYHVNGPSGTSRNIIFDTNTLARWKIRANTGIETGTNIGSDFNINRYSDTGTYISTPLSIQRSTGTITFGGDVVLHSDPSAALGATTKQYVDNNFNITQAGGQVRTISEKLSNNVTTFDYIPANLHASIIAGTYTTDVASYISTAYNAAVAANTSLRVIGGKYYIKSAINITGAANVIGDGWQESATPGTGSWFIHDNAAIIPFNISGSGSRGITFENLAFYQTHPSPTTGWIPTAYPFVFDIQNTLGAVTFKNIYGSSIRKFINSNNSGRLFLDRVTGQFFENLVTIDLSLDSSNFNDIHVWPFWSNSSNVMAWQQANGDAVRLNRVESPFFSSKQFYFGMRSAIKCSNNSNGVATRVHIDNVQAYGCKYTFWGDSTANGISAQIGQVDGQCEDQTNTGHAIVGSNVIQIDGTGARLQIGHLRGEIVGQSIVRLNQNSHKVDIGSFRGSSYNQDNNSSPAFYLANASAGTINTISLAITPFVEGSTTTLTNGGSNGQLIRPYGSGMGIDGLNYSYDSTNNRVVLTPDGAASTIGLSLQAKGTGSNFVRLINGQMREYVHDTPSANTYMEMKTDLNLTQILARSSTALNVDLFLTPQGTGNVNVGSSWNIGHFVMGIYHLWVDSTGSLRIKNSAPTSDTDGVVLGTQS